MSFIDFVFIPLVIFAGHFIVNSVTSRHKLDREDKSILQKLFYYHLFFALLFGWYVSTFGGDSVGYWRHPGRFWKEEGWLGLHSPGTPYVYFITYPLSQLLGLSFWGGTVLFSLFGFLGVVFLYLLIPKVLPTNPSMFGYKLFPAILFMPNMHFWSGGIGKDSMVFFSICLFIYSIANIRKNIHWLIFSFYITFFIRPHIALVMLVGLGLALLVSSRGASPFWRFAFLLVSIGVFVVISPTVFDFIGVDQESLDNYESLANVRSKNLSRSSTGSAIAISDYPLPLKLFTFFFRPLFFDAINLFGFIVSFENLFYFILTLSVLRIKSVMLIYRMPVVLKACVVISIATAFFMSSSLGNLGIVIRQKNMVMFMFLLVLLYLLSHFQYKPLNRSKRSEMSKVDAQTP